MATGRRDYTWGFLQDSVKPGRYSANFFKAGSDSIVHAGSSAIIDYTVPAGYRFYLTSINITTSSPAINSVMLLKDSNTIVLTWFSLNYVFDFGNWGSYPYEAGENLQVVCVNYDNYTSPFYASCMGVLEEIV